MIKEFLSKLAKKYLGLVDKPTVDLTNALVPYEQTIKQLQAVVDDKGRELASMRTTMTMMKQKYPNVWFRGNVANGCVNLPNLGIAVEFYRHENQLHVIAPWADAAGHSPLEFVPEWLEVDVTQKCECLMDSMNGTKVIIHKIPIKGWDDTIELKQKLEEDHPTYGIDGKMQDKTRSFTNSLNMKGTFRREECDGKLNCRVMFHQDDAGPDPFYNCKSVLSLLPKGNLDLDMSRNVTYGTYGEKPNRTYWWLIPVVEVDKVAKLPSGKKKSKKMPKLIEGSTT